MRTPPNNSNNISDEKMGILYFLFSIILLLWIGSYFIINYYYPDPQKSGTVGDTFGAINALFSGLAFCGIIYTILLQRKELRLQREELVHTREELKRSADAQEKTEKQMERQANNLKISATLSALSALATYHENEAIQKRKNGDVFWADQSDRKNVEYYQKIEKILNEKECDFQILGVDSENIS